MGYAQLSVRSVLAHPMSGDALASTARAVPAWFDSLVPFHIYTMPQVVVASHLMPNFKVKRRCRNGFEK